MGAQALVGRYIMGVGKDVPTEFWSTAGKQASACDRTCSSRSFTHSYPRSPNCTPLIAAIRTIAIKGYSRSRNNGHQPSQSTGMTKRNTGVVRATHPALPM